LEPAGMDQHVHQEKREKLVEIFPCNGEKRRDRNPGPYTHFHNNLKQDDTFQEILKGQCRERY